MPNLAGGRFNSGLPTIAALRAGLALVWALGGLALRLGGALAFWAGLAGLPPATAPSRR